MSSAKKQTPKVMCSQCPEKPAIAEVAGQPVCVDCYTKLQTAHAAEQNTRLQHMRHAMAMMNYSEDLMWSMVGLGPRRRVRFPQCPSQDPSR